MITGLIVQLVLGFWISWPADFGTHLPRVNLNKLNYLCGSACLSLFPVYFSAWSHFRLWNKISFVNNCNCRKNRAIITLLIISHKYGSFVTFRHKIAVFIFHHTYYNLSHLKVAFIFNSHQESKIEKLFPRNNANDCFFRTQAHLLF